MQAVVVLPTIPDTDSPDDWYKRLCQKVSGVPLVIRVLATAARSGVTSVVVVRTSATPADWIRKRLQSPLILAVPIRVIGVEPPFDPTDPASWSLLAPALEPRFLWLPWNYVTLRRSLASIVSSGPRADHGGTDGWDRPGVVATDALLTAPAIGRHRDASGAAVSGAARCEPAGIAVTSDDTRRETERLLVRGSGKPSDGIYSNFNRRLCRPAVRWLSNTPVTANAVTMMGLPVTILSAYWYAQGHWRAYVIGALLYYFSVLIGEIDGMLARTKFQESPFGSRRETLTDYASYLFLWAGMSIGLSRQFGTPIWLELGRLSVVMGVLILVVLLRRRRVATSPDPPEPFRDQFRGSLDSDSSNPVPHGIQKISGLAKKGVMAHFVVLFTVLGLLPVFVGLAALGGVLTFAIVLFASERFFRAPGAAPISR